MYHYPADKYKQALFEECSRDLYNVLFQLFQKAHNRDFRNPYLVYKDEARYNSSGGCRNHEW